MFTTLYPSLRSYEKKLSNYLKRCIKSFDGLLKIIKEDITSSNTEMRDSICLEEKLTVLNPRGANTQIAMVTNTLLLLAGVQPMVLPHTQESL